MNTKTYTDGMGSSVDASGDAQEVSCLVKTAQYKSSLCLQKFVKFPLFFMLTVLHVTKVEMTHVQKFLYKLFLLPSSQPHMFRPHIELNPCGYYMCFKLKTLVFQCIIKQYEYY